MVGQLLTLDFTLVVLYSDSYLCLYSPRDIQNPPSMMNLMVKLIFPPLQLALGWKS
jgi:hypothetical protein